MKTYQVSITASVPYPKTFTYRVDASSHGRAAKLAFASLKREPAVKRKRLKEVSWKTVELGDKAKIIASETPDQFNKRTLDTFVAKLA
jgi:hypothetical protein